jgi:hypothetical protein
LGIGKTRLLALVKDYRTNANDFSIHYTRTTHTRTIPQGNEKGTDSFFPGWAQLTGEENSLFVNNGNLTPKSFFSDSVYSDVL